MLDPLMLIACITVPAVLIICGILCFLKAFQRAKMLKAYVRQLHRNEIKGQNRKLQALLSPRPIYLMLMGFVFIILGLIDGIKVAILFLKLR